MQVQVLFLKFNHWHVDSMPICLQIYEMVAQGAESRSISSLGRFLLFWRMQDYRLALRYFGALQSATTAMGLGSEILV